MSIFESTSLRPVGGAASVKSDLASAEMRPDHRPSQPPSLWTQVPHASMKTHISQLQVPDPFHTRTITPAQVREQQAAEAAFLDEAFSLPAFASNRICSWCGKFCQEAHLAECEKRVVMCPICREMVLAKNVIKHYQSCQERVLALATERVMSALALRRRQEEEAAEAARVAQLHQQAEADAAALRQRAASIVTRKQSLGNLLMSGVSFGNEGVAVDETHPSSLNADAASAEVLHADQPRKKSMVKINSQPELLFGGTAASQSSANFHSRGASSSFVARQSSVVATDGAWNSAPTAAEPAGETYNRSGSFFGRTQSTAAEAHRPSSVHQQVATASGGIQIVEPLVVPTQHPRHSFAGPMVDSREPSEAGAPAYGSSFEPVLRPRHSSVGPGFAQTADISGSRHSVSAPGPVSLSAPLVSASSFKHAAPEGSFSAKPAPPTELPAQRTASKAALSPSRKASVAHAGSVVSLASPGQPHRAGSVESMPRAPSTTSSSAMPPGMKRCKWCGLQAAIEHEKKCASRIVMCKKCSSMIKMKDKEEHVKICNALQQQQGGGGP